MFPMDKFASTIGSIVTQLEAYDVTREHVIALVRKLNRTSGRAIALLLQQKDATELIEAADALMQQISQLMSDLAVVTSWAFTTSGTEEYVELKVFHAIITDVSIPDPISLHVPAWIYIVALGDVVGELRRFILGTLLDNDYSIAVKYLQTMQNLFRELRGLEFSKTIASNLRKKVDVARTIIERTESDVLHYKLRMK